VQGTQKRFRQTAVLGESLLPLRNETCEIPDWLGKAIEEDVSGEPDAAADMVFDRIDQAVAGNRFDEIEALLRADIVPLCTEDVLIALLTATLPAKNHLPGRAEWVRAAKDRLITAFGYDDAVTAGFE